MSEKVWPVESRSEKDERNKVKLETIKKTVKQKRPSVIGVSALDRYQVIQLVRFRAAFDRILKRYQEWAESYPCWIKNIASIAFTSGHYAGVFIYNFADPKEYYQFNVGFSSFMGDLVDVEELTVTSSVVTGGRPARTLEELGEMLKKIGEAADLRPEAPLLDQIPAG